MTQGLLDVFEGAQSPRGQDSVGGQLLGELVLGGAVQAAAVMHDDDDLLGAQLALGDAERADRIVGDQAAGVADQVGVATLQAKHWE